MQEAKAVVCSICREDVVVGVPVMLTKDGGFIHTECYDSPFERWFRTNHPNDSRSWHDALLEAWNAAIEYATHPPRDTELSVTFDSSVLKRATYGPASKRLFIEFQNGGVWRYDDVPEEKWTNLKEAESAGHYYTTEIKGQHPSMRLKP